jgi:hypothetical protein
VHKGHKGNKGHKDEEHRGRMTCVRAPMPFVSSVLSSVSL